MEQGKMLQRSEAISFCLTLENVYEDYPFHDVNWCVMRHQKNQKVFAWIFDREDAVWINVKCSPEWRDFWRQTYPSILPAYHLNKEHWNSIISVSYKHPTLPANREVRVSGSGEVLRQTVTAHIACTPKWTL